MSEKKENRDWSKVNRRSTKQISFRATEAEAELVKLLADESELSVAEYVRTRATGGTIKRPAMRREDSQKVVQSLFAIETELARQGNNLNQIAKKKNSRRIFEVSPLPKDEQLIKEILKVQQEFLEALQGIWRIMS